ncbi:MAG: methyl-accepting chemotaxis protein [Deltaproteobacteria bacterium]|nr:methyl-accepting chemotaxis protein [Deltaproteobacteria bacterium]
MGIIFPVYASFFVTFNSRLSFLIFVAGCVLAGGLVGAISILITKITILKVVKIVSEELDIISSGEADLTKKIHIESDDILGELIEKFNNFINGMNYMVSLTQKNSNNSMDISTNLSENMNRTVEAVIKMGLAISGVKKVAVYQNDDFLSTKKALNSLNQTVLNVLSHILELYNFMDSLTTRLMEQSTVIENLIEIIDIAVIQIGAGKENNQTSLSTLSNNFIETTNIALDKNLSVFKKLNDFILKIEDISSRTGVLSINASIEAARSGTKGDGFKIIAQEVRKLAAETEDLTSFIKSTLEDSRKEIEVSKGRIFNSRNHFIEMFDETKSSFSKLSNGTESIRNNTISVKSSYDQISEMLNIIKKSMSFLKESSKTTLSTLEKLEESTTHITSGMNDMVNESVAINEMATNTKSDVDIITESVHQVSNLVKKYKTGENLNEKNWGDPY